MNDEAKRLIKLPLKFSYWIASVGFFSILFVCYKLYRRRLNFRKKKLDPRGVLSLCHVSLSFDGRVKKSLNMLVKLGKRTTIFNPSDAEEHGEHLRKGLSDEVELKKAGLSGVFSYFPYCFDLCLFLQVVCSNAKFLHCHDVNTAFMGLLSAKIRGQTLICDLHEWKSQTTLPEKGKNILACYIYKYIEKEVFNSADHVICVNGDLAELMQKDLGVKRKVYIVKNIPQELRAKKNAKKYSLRRALSIPSDQFIVYYVGQLSPYRNLDFILKELAAYKRITIVFQGTIHATYKKDLTDLALDLELRGRFFILPPVSYDEIPACCHGADVGIFLCDHKNSNSMKYSLPNKVFEYALGEIPFISEDIPVVRKFIEQYEAGSFVDSSKKGSLHDAIKPLFEKNVYEEKKKNVKNLRESILADQENEQSYEAIYETNQ